MATNSNPGNFANDREKASEAGKVGGQHSHGGGSGSGKSGDASHTASHRGGNFADDREKAREAGKAGGHASHGGKK